MGVTPLLNGHRRSGVNGGEFGRRLMVRVQRATLEARAGATRGSPVGVQVLGAQAP
jgi:hypothetical protein